MTIERSSNFRQLGSKTPGHRKYGTPGGVETTTGPLGQGLATAVGMAMAERTWPPASATTWSITAPMWSPATAA